MGQIPPTSSPTASSTTDVPMELSEEVGDTGTGEEESGDAMETNVLEFARVLDRVQRGVKHFQF